MTAQLMANGHALLDDVSGFGKTLIATWNFTPKKSRMKYFDEKLTGERP